MTPSDLVLELARNFPQGSRAEIAFALCMEPAQVNRICHSAGIPPLELKLRRKRDSGLNKQMEAHAKTFAGGEVEILCTPAGVPYHCVNGKLATAS
jgi:hypothetical protein